ncbi:MAG TPA: protein kinase, partial [Kofleriaceae bacterium]|nr:protein kinase [Kofleriaceae bacterium]
MSEAANALVGTHIGRYRLVGVLGKGGMGCVYEAVNEASGTRVAVKVIFEAYADDPEMAKRFFAEARAANAIRHEGIVNVIDVVTLPDRRPAIVMELIDGKTLREAVADGAGLATIVQLIGEVLDALAAAHAAGIIHRDLKPENILVTRGGHAKILDFGIAKMLTPIGGRSLPRTRTGAALGTPEYMSPEQISGGDIDGRTDVYAMGVVLFEAVTGRRPFEGATDFELMRAHLEKPAPSAREWSPDLPGVFDDVIARALEKNPRARFQSAKEMASALRAAERGVPTPRLMEARTVAARRGARPSPSPEASTVGDRPPRSRSRLVVVAAFASVAVAAALVVVSLQAGTKPAARPPDAAVVVEREREPSDAALREVPEDAYVVAVIDEPPDAAPPDARKRDARDASITRSDATTRIDASEADSKQIGVLIWDDPKHRRAFAHESYNVHRLDPLQVLPKARALAKQFAADAVLRGINAGGVTADGYVDLAPETIRYA